MRRECQEIIPGLLLGPLATSRSYETLQSLGVTHMYAKTPLSLPWILIDLGKKSVHPRPERGVRGQTAFSRPDQVPRAGRARQRGAEPHPALPRVSLRIFVGSPPMRKRLLQSQGVYRLGHLRSAVQGARALQRRDLALARVRGHVRDAVLSHLMGRGAASGTEQAVLYLAQWRLFDADQGQGKSSLG